MEASMPQIYRHVDLSTQNRGLVIFHAYEAMKDFAPHGLREEYSDSVRCINIPANVVLNQEIFIKILMKREEYRKYVRVFTWTFLPPIGDWRLSIDFKKFAF